jgi:hypothetical protein
VSLRFKLVWGAIVVTIAILLGAMSLFGPDESSGAASPGSTPGATASH